jgi:hypothetical protein
VAQRSPRSTDEGRLRAGPQLLCPAPRKHSFSNSRYRPLGTAGDLGHSGTEIGLRDGRVRNQRKQSKSCRHRMLHAR